MTEGKREQLRINLHVYDTDLGVYVQPEDEELYRKAAKRITETINTYANAFKNIKTDKEIMYMAFIDIALSNEQQQKRNDTQPLYDILSTITSEIESTLNTNKEQ